MPAADWSDYETASGLLALEKLDPCAGVRRALKDIATKKDEWAGIPLPLDGERLVIEPTYPAAKPLMECGLAKQEDETEEGRRMLDEYGPYKVRNRFHSREKGRYVVILDTEKQGITWGTEGGVHHLGQMLRTVGCSAAWGLEQEQRALAYLGTLVRHHQFKQYLLTGMFMETSPRSHVHYVFRKLRPTVAITFNDHGKIPGPRILCTLCMHPIGYYADSWAGAMCPTDDVIAHLMLMRGDEHMFWKRCTQHPAWSPLSGI